MTRDILVAHLPHVSSGNTVATPPPLECHVLFEWPLRSAVPKLVVRVPQSFITLIFLIKMS